MKILFVSTKTDPFTDYGSGFAQRTTLLLRACAQVAQTDVCVFTDNVEASAAPENCRLVFSRNIPVDDDVYVPTAQRFLGLLGKTSLDKIYKVNRERAEVTADLIVRGGYDMIVVRYLTDAVICGLAPYIDRLVIDIDDSPVKAHLMRLRLGGGLTKRMLPGLKVLPDILALRLAQKRCLASFYSDPTEVVNRRTAYLPNIPVRTMSQGTCTADEVSEDVVFFIGALDYNPNRHGITHFVKHVWPEVRRTHGSAILRIAGSCRSEEYVERWKAADGVEYLGFAECPEDEYSRCKLVVAPVYFGAGTNIKVLEAMSMGRPCVTTPKGVRGYSGLLYDGEDVLVAGDDLSYARHVCSLLDDARERGRIASHAMATVQKHFSYDAFTNAVKGLISSI